MPGGGGSAAVHNVEPGWSLACGLGTPVGGHVRLNRRAAPHPIVHSKRAEIAALRRELGARRLDVFAAVVTDNLDVDHRDGDVLVETEPSWLPLAEYFPHRTGLQRFPGRDLDIFDVGA